MKLLITVVTLLLFATALQGQINAQTSTPSIRPSQAQRKPAAAPVVPLPPVEEPCQSDKYADPTQADITLPSIITTLLVPGGMRYCKLAGTRAGISNRRTVIQLGSLRGIGYIFSERDNNGATNEYEASGNVEAEQDAVLGSGELGDLDKTWSVTCTIDKIDDGRTCHINRGLLFIWRFSAGYQVSVGSRNFPGSQISIRVDNRPALSASEKLDFIGPAAARVITQLRIGERVLTRYEEWPSRKTVDEEWSLRGMPEAIDIMDRAFLSLRKPR